MKNDNTKSILIKVITVVLFVAVAMIIVFVMNNLDHDESQLLQSTEATTEDTLIVEIPDEGKKTEAATTETDVTEESDVSEADSDEQSELQESTDVTDEAPVYVFRKQKLLDQHYQKHGIEMGFKSAEDYEKAASAVATNPKSLHKTESEDGDDCYYLEETNEFVVVSTDGYLRTYFKPDRGKAYFDKQ